MGTEHYGAFESAATYLMKLGEEHSYMWPPSELFNVWEELWARFVEELKELDRQLRRAMKEVRNRRRLRESGSSQRHQGPQVSRGCNFLGHSTSRTRRSTSSLMSYRGITGCFQELVGKSLTRGAWELLGQRAGELEDAGPANSPRLNWEEETERVMLQWVKENPPVGATGGIGRVGGRRGRRSREEKPESFYISKALSRLLRHEAGTADIPISNEGWVKWEDMMKYPPVQQFSQNGIYDAIMINEKQRFTAVPDEGNCKVPLKLVQELRGNQQFWLTIMPSLSNFLQASNNLLGPPDEQGYAVARGTPAKQRRTWVRFWEAVELQRLLVDNRAVQVHPPDGGSIHGARDDESQERRHCLGVWGRDFGPYRGD